MSTMTEPGFICSTASAVTRTGGLRPGTWAVVMTTSIAADDLVELGLLGGPLLGGQLAGVAAGAGRVDRRLELDELGAEALGLLARLGPDVVGLDDRAEAPARCRSPGARRRRCPRIRTLAGLAVPAAVVSSGK